MRKIFIYCKPCEEVVEKGFCSHAQNGYSRGAAPIARYFESPDGSKTYVPAQGSLEMPARLKKLGYTEKTISNGHEYSAVMKKMDKRAQKEHEAYKEKQQQLFEGQQKEAREELRQQLGNTPLGRDIYEEAIRRSEQQYEGRYSAGSYIDGFEN